MTLILFLFSLEAGYTPYLDTSSTLIEPTYYLEFTPEVILFDFLHITGSARVDMVDTAWTDDINFNPLNLSSLVDIYIEYSLLTIGYRHHCQHPIIAWKKDFYPLQSYDQAYDQFYIKISTRKGSQ